MEKSLSRQAIPLRTVQEDNAMSETPETPHEPTPRFNEEYEDPHYDDEDEGAAVEEVEKHLVRPTVPWKRKAGRLPPPPRRFYED